MQPRGLRTAEGRRCAHHEAPEVATGGRKLGAGGVPLCNRGPESSSPPFVNGFVNVFDATVVPLAFVAEVGLGRVSAMAAAPTRPAAPAPRVRAEIRASPLLRAPCRSEPGVGELFTSCSDPARGVR